MRTARALSVGLSEGRKWVQERVVGEGNEASMMAAKSVHGRHSSSICGGVGIRRVGVFRGVLSRARICLRR